MSEIINNAIDKIFAFLPEEGSEKWGIDRRIIKSLIADTWRATVAVILTGIMAFVQLIQIPTDTWYSSIAVVVIAMVLRFLGKLKKDYSK